MHVLVFYPPIVYDISNLEPVDPGPAEVSDGICAADSEASDNDSEKEESVQLDASIGSLKRLNRLITSVAEEFRGKIIFIRIPSTEQSLLHFFGIPATSLPQVTLSLSLSLFTSLSQVTTLN
jgi:hypothetical protein